jgi:hypothetical protein
MSWDIGSWWESSVIFEEHMTGSWFSIIRHIMTSPLKVPPARMDGI